MKKEPINKNKHQTLRERTDQQFLSYIEVMGSLVRDLEYRLSKVTTDYAIVYNLMGRNANKLHRVEVRFSDTIWTNVLEQLIIIAIKHNTLLFISTHTGKLTVTFHSSKNNNWKKICLVCNETKQFEDK